VPLYGICLIAAYSFGFAVRCPAPFR